MSKKPETCRVLVVALNRQRLAKIISLVEESRKNQDADDGSAGLVSIEFLPCVATMGSYEAEDGSQKRYLASVVYHDGSPMTKLFDDENVRSTLSLVAMVGYEWKDQDKLQLENFFKANNLTIEIDCVQANQEFESLQQEMNSFKTLSNEEKDAHLANQTMGPGKMVGFILNAADHVKEEKLLELQPPEPVEEPDAAQAEESSAIEAAKPQRLPPDPSLTRFACRMCRTVLFGEDDLATDHVQNLHSFKKANFNQRRPTVECQSTFCNVTVLEWLSPSGQDIEGKLACPKCASKIGHWKWAGAQCSCGTWVTPAIQIPASKVDTIQPVSKARPMSTISTPIW
jgi:dual specificity phosphatase 12